MRFSKHRLQRFEVGVNVGNDENLHGRALFTHTNNSAAASIANPRPYQLGLVVMLNHVRRRRGRACPTPTRGVALSRREEYILGSCGGVRVTPFPTANNSYSVSLWECPATTPPRQTTRHAYREI